MAILGVDGTFDLLFEGSEELETHIYYMYCYFLDLKIVMIITHD